MKIIEVMPITRFAPSETLSYFSNKDIASGSVVLIELRNKKIPGIALESKDVSDMKSDIKESSFKMKKILEVLSPNFFSRSFINTSKKTADHFATSPGSVMREMMPNNVLQNILSLNQSVTEKEKQNVKQTGFVFQGNDLERISCFKSLIREEFSRKKSVLLCAPSLQDINRTKKELEKGIENFVFVLHGSLSKKEIEATWNKAYATEHPILLIATPPYLCFEKSDIGTIIIERENSRLYKNQNNPYIDFRYFAEKIANLKDIKILFADTLLRIESIERYQNGELTELSPLSFRSTSMATSKVVDMRTVNENEKKDFKIISDDLKRLIDENKSINGNLFIFAARRGLSPITVCSDCGEVIKCNECNAPTNLHRNEKSQVALQSDDKAFFLCHHCGEKRSAKERCSNCQSWRLMPLGIGIEKVEEEILKYRNDVKIFRIDKDTAKNQKEAQKISKQFYSTPGSILIGTEMALSFVDKPLTFSAVSSIDSLFSIPDFRIRERILVLLLKIRSITERNFIIQTRNPEESVMNYVISGNTIDFYREEIKERKDFNYPPFYTLIKITTTSPKETAKEETLKMQKMFESFESVTFPAFIDTVKGRRVIHTLIRVPKDLWPNKNLLEVLKNLPPSFKINVDPENIL